MGFLESRCVYLYPLCRNPPELGSAHITRQISQPGPMDPRADTSMCIGCLKLLKVGETLACPTQHLVMV